MPEFGLSDREMDKIDQSIEIVLPAAQRALARGDISIMRWEINELLKLFRINLDPNSAAYRELGIELLKRSVQALQAVERGSRARLSKRLRLLSLKTPSVRRLRASARLTKAGRSRGTHPLPRFASSPTRSTALSSCMATWPVVKITRRHVLQLREALQEIPVRRTGKLRNAALPELVEWSKQHPKAPKVSNATVNKLLGGVQAVALWARDNGLIPDDVPWADPFANMRLQEDKPTREPWQFEELRLLFTSPVFTKGARPTAGRGEAAFWLPLLGLFTGARLGELAPLTVVGCDHR